MKRRALRVPGDSCRRLLSSSYRAFNPVDVGDRFVTFLLRNEQTMTALSRHVLLDHVGAIGTGTGANAFGSSGGGSMELLNNLNGQDVNFNSSNSRSASSNDIPREKLKQQRSNASIEIDAFQLLSLDPVLGNLTLRYPDTLLELLEDSTVQARQVLRGRMETALKEGVGKLKMKLKMLKNNLEMEAGNQNQNQNNNQNGPTTQLQPSHQKLKQIELECKRLQNQLSKMTHLYQSLRNSSQASTSSFGNNFHSYSPSPLHARLVHLPPHTHHCKPTLSSLTSSDVGTIIQISGTCIRTSPIRMMETTRYYTCLAKGCGHIFSCTADFGTSNNALALPIICPLVEDGECNSTSFAVMPEMSTKVDYQEMKVQESVSEDLVDRCHPGDEVVVVGSLHAEWLAGASSGGVEVIVGMSMKAHSVRVINADSEHGGSSGNGGHRDGNIVDLKITASGGTSAALAASSGNLREKFQREFDAFWADPGAKRRPIATRDYILRAVCPKLYGMHAVKLGLLLVLIGGASVVSEDDDRGDRDLECDQVANEEEHGERRRGKNLDLDESEDEAGPVAFKIGGDDDDDGNVDDLDAERGKKVCKKSNSSSHHRFNKHTGKAVRSRRRTQSHILLIGDPGTGKSQFLRFAAALSPRSVLTTGTGSSTAGLTCAAVRDTSSSGSKGNEFSLEAGALALADRGVCCIDEFGCMSKEDRTSIHEAMEQQTISVAKAGIIAKLNARATVVAVMNPHGGIYDDTQSVQHNSRLGSALLSRFDLIFKMIDQSQTERDKNIARFLLQQSIIPGSGYDRPLEIESLIDDDHVDGHWSMEKLRAYIATVREKFHPTLSPEASRLLENHYSFCRQVSGENKLPITVRFLESLIRLSQAHARLMYRNTVTIHDATAVVLLMECSANSTYDMFGGASGYYDRDVDVDDFVYTNAIETEFKPFDKADAIFEKNCQALLRRYSKMCSNNGNDDNNFVRGGFGDDGYNTFSANSIRETKFQSWDDVGPREPRFHSATSQSSASNLNSFQKDQWGRQMLSQVANSPKALMSTMANNVSSRSNNTPRRDKSNNSYDSQYNTNYFSQSHSSHESEDMRSNTHRNFVSRGNDDCGGCGNRFDHVETTPNENLSQMSSTFASSLNRRSYDGVQIMSQFSGGLTHFDDQHKCPNGSQTSVVPDTSVNASKASVGDARDYSPHHSPKPSNLSEFSSGTNLLGGTTNKESRPSAPKKSCLNTSEFSTG
ncbi:hypothetical protein ACHAXS_012558, partial [Conticribra weissflogii]